MRWRGAVAAGAAGLIVPVLCGPKGRLNRIAKDAQLDLSGRRIVPADGPEDTVMMAAMAAGAGDLAARMKGSLHSSQFLHAIPCDAARLGVARSLSHCAPMSVPMIGHPKNEGRPTRCPVKRTTGPSRACNHALPGNRRPLRGPVRLRSQHPHDPAPPDGVFVPACLADHAAPRVHAGCLSSSGTAIRRLRPLFRMN